MKSLLRQLERPPELALVDLGLPPTPHRPDEGFRLINELLALSPDIKILVLSGQNDENNARHARALGAIEFVAKPCEPQRLKQLLLEARAITAAERVAHGAEPGIIGTGPAIAKLKQQIRQYADAPFPVLIEGESGSGKELVAASLHRQSSRAMKPYLALNCAAISPNLVEPTLFGYAKGAFTGAASARAGYFEDARDGTLVPGRDRRAAAGAAGEAAARAGERRVPARRRDAEPAKSGARHRRHQPRPAPGSEGRTLPRRSLSSA